MVPGLWFMDPSVPVSSSTLVGQPPVAGFQHTGLGLEQQWYYRVRAVDGNGYLGRGLRPNWNIISSKSVLSLPVLWAASASVPGALLPGFGRSQIVEKGENIAPGCEFRTWLSSARADLPDQLSLPNEPR